MSNQSPGQPPGADAAERLAELESRLEFQDETLSKLNDELVLHQQRISELEKKVALMMERWPRGQLDHDPAEEPPPPHY